MKTKQMRKDWFKKNLNAEDMNKFRKQAIEKAVGNLIIIDFVKKKVILRKKD